MHATAQAQPNVALIKYWGKADPAQNIPAVPSLSITLDTLWTRTFVRFEPSLSRDVLSLNGQRQPNSEPLTRVTHCLDTLRHLAGVEYRAHVETRNNFPTQAGLASSASGFAALVTAGARALGLDLSARQRSVLARQSSGSAARSMFGGFVELDPDGDAEGGAAVPILPAEAWPLEVSIAITSQQAKPSGSTEGMTHTARTSGYYDAWVTGARDDFLDARSAVRERDFTALADLSELSCLKMHGLMLSADPALIYWNGVTVECIHRLRKLRRSGVPVFFTIDAGPQVKAISLPEAGTDVRRALRDVPGVIEVLSSRLGCGAHLIPEAACV